MPLLAVSRDVSPNDSTWAWEVDIMLSPVAWAQRRCGNAGTACFPMARSTLAR
jgi:hypothetical protein